eukprot:CAMPEP_0172879324 /NCGR_PEP_ID=MMETSP1075-20121228/112159_1 /TAXON_ID=2916 /ORGANISM="Ceratium fusus, Strain PA161109" /LENGTH=53 /DNA_ID=CAMNT_0013731311 /DNA_START=64 /DNA_END=222 /DNA_ORIENTATION=+
MARVLQRTCSSSMKFTTRGVELNGSCMVEDATPVTPYRSPVTLYGRMSTAAIE